MTCGECGSLRLVLSDRVACPRCEGIVLGDQLRAIRESKAQLREAFLLLSKLLTLSERRAVFRFALSKREEAAARLLQDADDLDLARTWVAAAYLLVKSSVCSSDTGAVPLNEVLFSSEEVIRLDDRVQALQNNNIEVLDDGTFVRTEKERITEVPGSVLQEIRAEIGGDWNALDDMDKVLGNDIVYPIREVIASETLSRSFSSVFHRRLAPDLNTPWKTTAFSEICMSLAAEIAFTIGPAFESDIGVLPVSNDLFKFIKRTLEKEFGKRRITWFFSLVGQKSRYKLGSLGYSVIVREASSRLVYLPYHTLYMLALNSYKYTASRNIGIAANYKGRVLEDLLFNAVTPVLNTKHPENGAKLLRYRLPRDNGDIDVGGFNGRNLLLVEAKFWDEPTIASLEKELEKFKRRTEYVQQNLTQLGFKKGLKITPVFFTPYAPFSKWKGILLMPSVSALILFLLTKFGKRRFKLILGDSRIRQFVQTDEGERLFALDGSRISSQIPEDTYRVQDGVVVSVEDDEVTVYVMTPPGRVYPLFCEVTKSVVQQLKGSGVEPGTVIRMGLFNVLGGWAPVQLCCFRVEKSAEETKGQSPDMILTLANASSAQEEFVLSTWGDHLGKEILDFLKRWNIDLPKLLARFNEKGQNYLSGVGIALGLADIYDHVEQCSCGDVFGTSKDLAARLPTLYSDGKLRCKSCDPEFPTKIHQLTGDVGMILSHGAMMELAAHRLKPAKRRPHKHKKDTNPGLKS